MPVRHSIGCSHLYTLHRSVSACEGAKLCALADMMQMHCQALAVYMAVGVEQI